MKRTRKTALTEAADSLEERVDRLESMMQRVEQIVVIDSITVRGQGAFLRHTVSALRLEDSIHRPHCPKNSM